VCGGELSLPQKGVVLMRRVVLVGFIAVGICFLAASPALAIKTDSPNLPPCQPAHYVTADEFHAQFPTANPPFTISAADHLAMDGCGSLGGTPPPVGNGNMSIDNFFSQLHVETNFGPFTGAGPVSVKVTATNDPTMFDTEMLSMNISGGSLPPGVMIRESPTRQSLGKTTVMPMGPGMWSIDSFFDVFTDVSFDGGQTWHESLTSGRVTLVPEPASLALFGLGFVALFGRRSRLR
jgi:hypothetical protein